MGAPDTDVLVVGAGPTGLTLANILGLHGIRTTIVERNPATVSEPRAVSIDDESLRTMQYIDLVDAVSERIVPGYGSYYYSAGGACFARVVPDTLEYGFPRRSAFRQPVLEAQLREGLKRFDCVEARFGTHVASVRDVGSHVEAGEVKAKYLVACDGASSSIREALGIGMSGSTYDCRWLIVDLAGSTDRFRHTRVYCDPARPCLALPGPEGTRRYEFMLLPGEDPDALLEDSSVRRLLALHSDEDPKLPIVRKVVYHFHARLAERWRSGRVFLAGDAAHLSPPFAGQGMNSGLRDAQNLGWKLAACIRGELGPGLLDTYEQERKPHAAALIRMAVRMGRVMMPRSRWRALATQGLFKALSLHGPARDYVMQMKWKPPPRFTEGFVAGDAGGELRGRMFIQPRVERDDGTAVLLDTLLGKGFAVVECTGGVVQVSPCGPAAGQARQARDVAGVIGALFQRAGIRGVLLRPDRYVAACIARDAGAQEADRLMQALRAGTFR